MNSGNSPNAPSGVVRGVLEGDDRSMQTIERLFAGNEAHIEKVDDQWVLVANELNQLWGVDGAVPLHHAATAIVRRFNGIARAEEPHYRPVRNVGRYEGPSHTAVVAHDTASVRDIGLVVELNVAASATRVASNGSPSPPRGPDYLQKVAGSQPLDEVLDILGGPDELSTYDLWKVLELVRAQVGAPAPQDTQALVNSGLIDWNDWNALNNVIHNRSVSGSAARHALLNQPLKPTPVTYTIEQARERVSRLVREWMRTV